MDFADTLSMGRTLTPFSVLGYRGTTTNLNDYFMPDELRTVDFCGFYPITSIAWNILENMTFQVDDVGPAPMERTGVAPVQVTFQVELLQWQYTLGNG